MMTSLVERLFIIIRDDKCFATSLTWNFAIRHGDGTTGMTKSGIESFDSIDSAGGQACALTREHHNAMHDPGAKLVRARGRCMPLARPTAPTELGGTGGGLL